MLDSLLTYFIYYIFICQAVYTATLISHEDKRFSYWLIPICSPWGNNSHFVVRKAAQGVCMIILGTPTHHYRCLKDPEFIFHTLHLSLPMSLPCPSGLYLLGLLCFNLKAVNQHHPGWTPDPPTCCCCFSTASCTSVRTQCHAASGIKDVPALKTNFLNSHFWFFPPISPNTGQCARGQQCEYKFLYTVIFYSCLIIVLDGWSLSSFKTVSGYPAFAVVDKKKLFLPHTVIFCRKWALYHALLASFIFPSV